MSTSNEFDQSKVIMPSEWFSFAIRNAWSENIRQYQRTLLGPIWIIVSQIVYILGIAFVYGSVFNADPKQMMPYLSSGIITWTYISTILSTSPSILVANGSILNSFQIPLSTFSVQNLARHLIVFAHGLVIHVVVMLLYGDGINAYVLLFIPGLVLVLLVLYPFSYVISVLGARFRDIGPAIGASVYFLFLISPIIWNPSTLPANKQFIATFNPIFHLMTVVRYPMIMRAPELYQYGVVVVIGIICWALAFWVSKTIGKKVVFWV